MTTEEKNKVIHDVNNSFAILNNISKSATNFVDKFFIQDTLEYKQNVEIFKKAMVSLQEEVAKLELVFKTLIK
ncbi:MAG: hypothetical protein H0U75_00720 [Legionella sp.]|nr:hypothetical protein [Legionella sp.]